MGEIFEKTLLTAFSLFLLLSLIPLFQVFLTPIINQSDEITKMKNTAENDLNLFLNRFNQFNVLNIDNNLTSSDIYYFVFTGEIIIIDISYSSQTNLIFYFYYNINKSPFSYTITILNNCIINIENSTIQAYYFSYDQNSIFLFFF